MTCSEIKERTVDFLYGELPEAERGAFEAHLAGCDACRAEVAGLQGTLHRARAAVRTLDEAPPPRVRAVVLEAARAAAGAMAARTSGAGAGELGAAAAAPWPRRSEPGKTEESGGFWAWLRRPWLLPLVGAATAVAIFMIARDKINKPDLFDMKAPAPPSAVAPVAAPAPPTETLSAPPPPAAEKASARPESRRRSLAKPPRPMSASAPAPQRQYAEPPPVRRAEPRDKADGEEGFLGGRGAAGKPEADRAKAGILGEMAKEAKRERAQPTGAASGAGAGKAADHLRRNVEVSDDELESARVAPAPAPAPTQRSGPSPVATAAPRPAPAARPAAPPAPKPSAPRADYAPAPPAAAPEPEAAPVRTTSLASEEASAPARPMKAKKAATSPFTELVNKAERAYAARRWDEAAGAYRELLRLYSENKSVALWRARLRACEQALQH